MKEKLEEQIKILEKAQDEAFKYGNMETVKTISETIFNYLQKLSAYM